MKLYRLCCKKCGKQIGTYILSSKTMGENLKLSCLLVGEQPYEKDVATQFEQEGIKFDLICFKCGEK